MGGSGLGFVIQDHTDLSVKIIDGSEKVNRQKCRIEWNFAKELIVREYYPVGHITELWKMLATHHSDEVRNFIKLCQVALVSPTNTAGCERGFSAQNRIKNALRNRLKAEMCS